MLMIVPVIPGTLWADQQPDVPAPAEEVFTGQLVALWSYLREGRFGIGRLNTNRQLVYIRHGSPMTLKVGAAFYYLAPKDEQMKHWLVLLVGHQVTIRGNPSVEGGRPVILVSSAQPVKPPAHVRGAEPPQASRGPRALQHGSPRSEVEGRSNPRPLGGVN